jgi:hypothetical protein
MGNFTPPSRGIAQKFLALATRPALEFFVAKPPISGY